MELAPPLQKTAKNTYYDPLLAVTLKVQHNDRVVVVIEVPTWKWTLCRGYQTRKEETIRRAATAARDALLANIMSSIEKAATACHPYSKFTHLYAVYDLKEPTLCGLALRTARVSSLAFFTCPACCTHAYGILVGKMFGA